jgi:hypothetical protein
MSCTIIDIATGGLFVEGKFSFYPDDVIELRFQLEKRNISVRCKISNVSGKKAGAKFKSIEQSDMDFIQEFIHDKFFKEKK